MSTYDNFYMLIDGKTIKCKSIKDVKEAFENRWQIKSYVKDKMISTVFLVLDHAYLLKGPPVLFETMVFPDQDICIRYHTYEEAIAGHDLIVDKIKKGENINENF